MTSTQQTALRGLFACLILVAVLAWAFFVAGCASIEKNVHRVPSIDFESWTHSDRYGVFTDNVVLTGATWTLNPDGSATLKIDYYDGSAAWAGMVGPHDTIKNLRVHFPPQSPQAQALAAGTQPPIPKVSP